MVVTGSRKEAVRYKLEFDKYVAGKGYKGMRAMVAFSGEVTFGVTNGGKLPHGFAIARHSNTPRTIGATRMAFGKIW